jgi:hypothetical protein
MAQRMEGDARADARAYARRIVSAPGHNIRSIGCARSHTVTTE